MKITKKIIIEIEVEVEGNYSAGSPGSFYRANGDPGDPPEYPEFEIHTVTYNGKNITKIIDEIGFDWFQLEKEILEDIE